MIDEETTEKIERLASETIIKITAMIPTLTREKSKTAQKELMKLRLDQSIKMKEYLVQVYDNFDGQRF